MAPVVRPRPSPLPPPPPGSPGVGATPRADAPKKDEAPRKADAPKKDEAAPPAHAPRAAPSKETSDAAKAKAASDPIAASKQRQLQKAFDADFPPSPAELQSDRRYQRLPRETQRAILSSLDRAKDGETRNNISRLAIDGGFAQCEPADQKRLLDTLEKKPGDKELGESVTKLAGSARFRGLDADARANVLAGMQQDAACPGAATNYAALGTSKGLAAMSPSERALAVDALKKQPADKELVEQVDKLGTNPTFAQLSADRRTEVLESFKSHTGTDAWANRKLLGDLVSEPAFGRLDDAEQKRMIGLMGSTDKQLSPYAKVAMVQELYSDEFKAAKPAEQTERLRKFMKSNDWAPSSIDQAIPEEQRVACPPLGEPKIVKAPFQGGTVEAERYTLHIDGREIPITRPTKLDPKDGQYQTPEEIAKGIRGLPKHSRDAIKEVRIEPKQNNEDYLWRQTPGYSKTHVSYMTSGAEGIIRVFPTSEKKPQETVDTALSHETGHTVSGRGWGGDTNGKKWDPYKAAIKSDGYVPSAYGKSSPADDLAETMVIYNRVKGTPEEAATRALMPKRFELIDELIASQQAKKAGGNP